MFERYTENARRTLFFARYEASQLGQLEITAEHLLLGILREENSFAASVLNERGLRLQETREAVMKLPTDRPATAPEDFARASATLVLAEPPSACRDVAAAIREMEVLLDRLATLTSNNEEARSLIRDIRDRIRALGSDAP
jgi:ATP-dependent Clp protease ATP-binding subunit ClpA